MIYFRNCKESELPSFYIFYWQENILHYNQRVSYVTRTQQWRPLWFYVKRNSRQHRVITVILTNFNKCKIETLPDRSYVLRIYAISVNNSILQRTTEVDCITCRRGTIIFGDVQLHVFHSFSLFMHASALWSKLIILVVFDLLFCIF